jgi:Cu/Ag efflux pump CusA
MSKAKPTGAPEVRIDEGPISWMAKNPVAANLLMATLIIGGLLMSLRLRKEVFPRIEPDQISITVAYPGASPAEVEQGILLAVEEAVRPIDGVKEVRSTAMEGVGMTTTELEVGTDKTKALSDVKNAVDRITSFPNEAERPIVNLPEWSADAISVVLFADQEEKVLHALGERIRDELLKLPEVSFVEPVGVRPLEISIEVSQEDLRRYGLTLPSIASLVRRTAIELPAGGVKTRDGEVLLRTAERRDLGAEFANIAVITGADGNPVKLGDIADIVDGFAERRGQRGQGLREKDGAHTAPGHQRHYLARSRQAVQRAPGLADAQRHDRPDRGPADPGPVPGAQAGLLGDDGHPHFVPGIADPAANHGHLGEHDLAVRLHRHPGHGG